MDSGVIFMASLAGMFFGTIVMALELYVVYRLGYRLGQRDRPNRPLWKGLVLIGLGPWPISLWPFLIDWDPFLQAGVALSFYVAIAFPLATGYGAAKDLFDRESRRRWRKNADDWLGEWECEPAPVSSEDDTEEGGD